jgi:hypothetical protein
LLYGLPPHTLKNILKKWGFPQPTLISTCHY